jgi:hypothetical protein
VPGGVGIGITHGRRIEDARYDPCRRERGTRGGRTVCRRTAVVGTSFAVIDCCAFRCRRRVVRIRACLHAVAGHAVGARRRRGHLCRMGAGRGAGSGQSFRDGMRPARTPRRRYERNRYEPSPGDLQDATDLHSYQPSLNLTMSTYTGEVKRESDRTRTSSVSVSWPPVSPAPLTAR